MRIRKFRQSVRSAANPALGTLRSSNAQIYASAPGAMIRPSDVRRREDLADRVHDFETLEDLRIGEVCSAFLHRCQGGAVFA